MRISRFSSALYPIRGFLHVIQHPAHIGSIFVSIAKVIAASSITVIPIFTFGYVYQHRALKYLYMHFISQHFKKHAISSVFLKASSVFLCLFESSIVTLQISGYFIGNVRNRLFDSLLQERNGLPKRSRRKSDEVGTVAERVGGALVGSSLTKHFLLSPLNLMIMSAEDDDTWSIVIVRSIISVVTLPINAVPIVGPIFYVSIQAVFRGGMSHRRYFQLYDWSPAQRQRRVEEHFLEYQSFGLVATLLEMTPFLGLFFIYTNQIGAAMWAMDLHDRKLLEPSSIKND
ncbi:hypothetical protein BDF20DRAFT_202033 [Mycotypha africana]|uniref:uncharacterized protein n=1 Tax=Mycotypha africana TaxID=64632 RepID=UPI0022FFF067|nr:uncharacterized protein BDF20DRAFT_202033 [Mycotypha africana]KAI8967979.1 hypothetical protein BDF20DRAFT_202033 [Mycotypha africana]